MITKILECLANKSSGCLEILAGIALISVMLLIGSFECSLSYFLI